nr:catecholate siderophore receptor Fiu [Serratia sp. 1D1416]
MNYIKNVKTSPARISNDRFSFSGVSSLTLFTGLCMGASGASLAETAPPAPASEERLVTADAPDSFYIQASADPKFTRPQKDTTRTMVLIPEALIKEQGATTLTAALKNVAGAGAFFAGENGNSTTGDAVYMRGFDTSNSLYLDGMRNIASVSRDTFNTEQIEVFKGPSGADYGRSAPSGSINQVSKQPRMDTGLDASASLGSARYRRATLDYNQAFGETSAIRLNLLGEKAPEAGRRHVRQERFGVAPSFAYGLGTATRLYLNYLHLQQDNVPDGGVPTLGLPGYSAPSARTDALNDAGKVNSRNFYGTRDDRDNSTTDTATLRLERDLTDNLTLRNTTRWSQVKQDYLLSAFMIGDKNVVIVDANRVDTWTASRLANTKDARNTLLSNQTNLTGKFSTGTVRHDVSAGVEFTRERQTHYGLHAVALPAVNIYRPDPSVSAPAVSRNGANANGTTETFGLYAFDTLELGRSVEINGGVRLDSYRTSYDRATACGGSGRRAVACPPGIATNTPINTLDIAKTGNLFNWKAGALYHITERGNAYLNYGISQQPPGGNNFSLAESGSGSSANRTDFKPQKAKTIEIGTKWALLGNHLLLTAALFRTDIENEVGKNDDATYSQYGKKRVQGYELGMVGNITPDWRLFAGYTLQNASIRDGANAAQDGSSALTYTPKRAFTLWTHYQITDRLTLGGGARYVGGMKRGKDGAVGTPAYTEGYWVADAMAGYKINKHVDVQLNLNNLFDKDYVSSINKSGYRYHPGDPRTFMLTTNVHF